MFALTPSLTAIAVVGTAFLLLALVQPMLLKLACSLCGQTSPGFLKALVAVGVAFVASLVGGLVYSVTLGLLMSQLSATLSVIGGLVVALGITGVVYSGFLRVSTVSGIGVALVHHGVGVLLSGGMVLALKMILRLVP